MPDLPLEPLLGHCLFCGQPIDDCDEAIPDFWVGGFNYNGPVCWSCVAKFLHRDTDQEWALDPEVALPANATRLES